MEVHYLYPQLILFYSSFNKIDRVIFLSHKLEETCKAFSVYKLLKKSNNIPDPEIIKDHILLTFNLPRARGYIKNLLNIDEDIILYSIFNNFDYSTHDNNVYNPFVHSVDISEPVPNDTILYELDNTISTGAIFCVTLNKYVGKNLSREHVVNSIYSKYINSIIDNIANNSYELSSELINNNLFSTNIDMNKAITFIDNDNDYKKHFV